MHDELRPASSTPPDIRYWQHPRSSDGVRSTPTPTPTPLPWTWPAVTLTCVLVLAALAFVAVLILSNSTDARLAAVIALAVVIGIVLKVVRPSGGNFLHRAAKALEAFAGGSGQR
ncbi:hypothetical protein ACWDSF_06835 [Nocardia beijingensis]